MSEGGGSSQQCEGRAWKKIGDALQVELAEGSEAMQCYALGNNDNDAWDGNKEQGERKAGVQPINPKRRKSERKVNNMSLRARFLRTLYGGASDASKICALR